MTDTIEQKALALLNEVQEERGKARCVNVARRGFANDEALCRAIEQHEAFRQEVSDALLSDGVFPQGHKLSRFIIPKLDPLVRVINEVIYAQPLGDIDEVRMADNIRAALKARGLEIREKGK